MSIMKDYFLKFKYLKKILGDKVSHIVEVGSHYGEDSLRLAQTFPQSKIYCFEPDPRNINIFKKHIINKNIKLYEVALSDKNGEAEFFLSHQKVSEVPGKYDWISWEDYNNLQLNNSGASSLKQGYEHTLNDSITVPILRFDTWCESNSVKNIDFAWIDTQGAEREVVEGMGEKITLIKNIWMEYGEMMYEGAMSREDTVSLLDAKGFELIETQEVSGYDLLFTKK